MKGDCMRFECAIGKIRYMLSVADKFLTRRITEENLPILSSHIPLFYILPVDKSAIVFGEVSKRWQISKSSLSDIINKYQGLGIISKHECLEDKRSIYIALTDEGLKIRETLKVFEAEFLELLLTGLADDEKKEFEGYLDQAVQNAINFQKS